MGLPYSEEKMMLLLYASLFQAYYGTIEKARKLIDYIEGQAREHNDLRETTGILNNRAASCTRTLGTFSTQFCSTRKPRIILTHL